MVQHLLNAVALLLVESEHVLNQVYGEGVSELPLWALERNLL